MSIIELISLGLALGTDAFSVSLAIGTKKLNLLLTLKLGLIIGLFHIIMPLLGLKLGLFLHNFFGNYYFTATIDSVTTLIGSSVLILLGIIMIYENMTNSMTEYNFKLYGWPVIILALSVSIDALSVGFSLGMLNVEIIFSCIVLGIIASLMVISGLVLGNKVADLLVNKAEIIGGIILILLGIHFILSIA